MQPWHTMLGVAGEILRFAAGALTLATAVIQSRRPRRHGTRARR